jgi:hypothetical protein
MDAITTFVSQFNSEVNTLSQVRVRLEELLIFSEWFEEYQPIVEGLDQSDELRMEEQTVFKEMFYNVKSSFLHILERNKKIRYN